MADSIFKQLVENLPPDPKGVLTTVVVAFGIGIGALTALLGALHSRVTISLMMLSVGAIFGAWLPAYLGLSVDHAVPIGMGCIIFGLLGFLLHRVCVAMSLGVLVAAASLVILYDQTQPIDTTTGNVVQFSGSFWTYARAVWDAAPARFRELAPWVASIGFFVSVILGLIFRKFGMAALYSLGGTMLTLFCIRLGHESDKIGWLDSIKSGPMTIAVLGMAMLLIGFVTQMVLLNRPAAEKEVRVREEVEA